MRQLTLTAQGRPVHLLFPDEEEHLAHWIELGIWYEQSVLEEIRRHVPSGATFVDVGAHLGNHSLWFATEGEAACVYAIEPHQWTFDTLKATIALNHVENVVKPIHALIHPTWETASLDFSEHEGAPWMRIMLPRITKGGDTPCITLNEALKNGADALKIDVEEMGSQVLASGIEMIKEHEPVIAIEAQGDEIQAVNALLVPIGYKNLGQFQEHGTPTFIWIKD